MSFYSQITHRGFARHPHRSKSATPDPIYVVVYGTTKLFPVEEPSGSKKGRLNDRYDVVQRAALDGSSGRPIGGSSNPISSKFEPCSVTAEDRADRAEDDLALMPYKSISGESFKSQRRECQFARKRGRPELIGKKWIKNPGFVSTSASKTGIGAYSTE
ncbi:hypothetical protein BHM03_00008346 [Ensete ventricosum]|nr:hypothetical protein BHM03_00008346 [Ensete ventricosum]